MDTPASPANDVVTLKCDRCGNDTHHPAIYTCLNVWEAAEGYEAIYGWEIMLSDCPVAQAEYQAWNRAYQSQQHMIESYNYVVLMVKCNKGKLAWTRSMANYYNRRDKCYDNTEMERLAGDLLHKAETKGMSSQLFSTAPIEVRSAVLEHLNLIEKLKKHVSP